MQSNLTNLNTALETRVKENEEESKRDLESEDGGEVFFDKDEINSLIADYEVGTKEGREAKI